MSQRNKDVMELFQPENMTDLQITNLLKRISQYHMDKEERDRRLENERVEEKMKKLASLNPEKEYLGFNETVRGIKRKFVGHKSSDKDHPRYAYGFIWQKV